jgi:hypothetical protein
VEGELHLLLDYVINRYQYLHTDQDDNKPLQKIRLPVLKDLLKKPDVVLQITKHWFIPNGQTSAERINKHNNYAHLYNSTTMHHGSMSLTSTNFNLKSRFPNLCVNSYSS